MICVSVDQEADFDESIAKWVHEVRGVCLTMPIVFVLMKKDLLDEEGYVPKFDVNRMIRHMNEHKV